MPETPNKIAEASANAVLFPNLDAPDENGRGVCLNCAGLIAVSISKTNGQIDRIGFGSGGCEYMNAAASVLAEKLRGPGLDSFGAKTEQFARECIESELGAFPAERSECIQGVLDAFQGAIADGRSGPVNESHGDEALVCTCFGITEDRLFAAIRTMKAADVETVAEACNAGSGCGSCRMLIQDYIDAYVDESDHSA